MPATHFNSRSGLASPRLLILFLLAAALGGAAWLWAQDADSLHHKLVEAVGLAGAPRKSDVQYWISQASALDIIEEPEPAPPTPVVK